MERQPLAVKRNPIGFDRDWERHIYMLGNRQKEFNFGNNEWSVNELNSTPGKDLLSDFYPRMMIFRKNMLKATEWIGNASTKNQTGEKKTCINGCYSFDHGNECGNVSTKTLLWCTKSKHGEMEFARIKILSKSGERQRRFLSPSSRFPRKKAPPPLPLASPPPRHVKSRLPSQTEGGGRQDGGKRRLEGRRGTALRCCGVAFVHTFSHQKSTPMSAVRHSNPQGHAANGNWASREGVGDEGGDGAWCWQDVRVRGGRRRRFIMLPAYHPSIFPVVVETLGTSPFY